MNCYKEHVKIYCKIGVGEKFLVPQITIHKTGDFARYVEQRA